MTALAPPPFRLESLNEHHQVTAFTCRDVAIDRFLRDQALAEQRAGLCSVTVAINSQLTAQDLVGFFTLSPLSIPIDSGVLTALGIEQPQYRGIGGYLLGRLRVDTAYQGKGVGKALVAVALAEVRRLRAGAGGVFLAVDPKDDDLVAWYERLGFRRLHATRRRVVIKLQDP